MSKNATIEGELKFETEEDLEKAVEDLKDKVGNKKVNEWINEENFVIKNNILRINRNHYRNLIFYTDDLCELAESGKIVSVCYDGMEKGYVETESNTQEYDMRDWYNDFPDPELMDLDFDSYVEGQMEAMEAFFRKQL